LVHIEGSVEMLGRPRKEDGLRTPRMGAVSKRENGVRTIIGRRRSAAGRQGTDELLPYEGRGDGQTDTAGG